MVGAGEVDDELEGEVKEECSTKYGDVVKVTILEVTGTADTEAVRIFVEFKRIENSIKGAAGQRERPSRVWGKGRDWYTGDLG